MKFLLVILSVLIFSFAMPKNAWSQKLLPEANQEEEETLDPQEIFPQLPVEIQEEILAESEQVFKECEYEKGYARYRDCRCLAVKFMDERTIRGPEEDKLKIWYSVQDECKFEEGIAGESFRQCMSTNAKSDMKKVEQYCNCFANSIAKLYKESESTQGYYFMRNISVKAYAE